VAKTVLVQFWTERTHDGNKIVSSMGSLLIMSVQAYSIAPIRPMYTPLPRLENSPLIQYSIPSLEFALFLPRDAMQSAVLPQ